MNDARVFVGHGGWIAIGFGFGVAAVLAAVFTTVPRLGISGVLAACSALACRASGRTVLSRVAGIPGDTRCAACACGSTCAARAGVDQRVVELVTAAAAEEQRKHAHEANGRSHRVLSRQLPFTRCGRGQVSLPSRRSQGISTSCPDCPSVPSGALVPDGACPPVPLVPAEPAVSVTVPTCTGAAPL